MKFYTVNDDYIKHLASYDQNVRHNKQEKRPYVGIVLDLCGHQYLAPLTSPKDKHDKLRSSCPTIFKMHNKDNEQEKLGMIQLNNMIPVLLPEITYVEFSNHRADYKNLLIKQLDFIKSKQDAIKDKAHKLHTLVTVKKHPSYCKVSCNFSVLESIYLNYKK